MRRTVLLYSVVVVLLTANSLVFSQSEVRQKARPSAKRPVCDFDITGLWRTDATSQSSPVFFQFSPKGWVMLMGHTPNALPQDFEQMDSVYYKLDNPSNPKELQISAPKGNDFFVRGVTSLRVIGISEDRFTTRNIQTGAETTWTRETTHRYFLAFVAKTGTPPQGGPAFVMWTMMDGRETRVEPLGVHVADDENGKPQPVFGPIPQHLYDQIREPNEEEKKRGQQETVIMRFELTGRDFKKTYKVFEAWDKLVKERNLPASDHSINVMNLIEQAANSLEPCGENIKLQKLDRIATDEITAKYKPSQRPLEYIRVMRQRNMEIHVPDRFFPWAWRPTVQLN